MSRNDDRRFLGNSNQSRELSTMDNFEFCLLVLRVLYIVILGQFHILIVGMCFLILF